MELISSKILNKLLNKNDTYVIAVSTGIDSMSLLDYLYKNSYKLVIAHVNHKRRVESDDEYKFLKEYANKLNIPFEGYVLTQNIESNFQMEARNIRYNFFKEVCKKYNTKNIITAHQADDLVETLIFRLIRGTSLKGYGSINEVSESDGYKVIRPLLYTRREEIEKYQKENNIPYFNDSSNDENHYTRNKIRHNITPEFKNINESYYNAIFNFKEDMSDLYEHIRKESENYIRKYANLKEACITFNIESFNKLDRAIKREVIILGFNIISNNSLEVPHERINKILEVDMTNESKEIEINNLYSLYVENNIITIKKKIEHINIELIIDKCGEYEISNNTKILISQKTHLLPKKNSYMLCYNMEYEIFPITVRNVKMGDKITVNNITKKIYDLLKEHKVPKSERDNTLVFLNKDGIFFIPNIIRKETDTNKNNKIYITVIED